MYAGCYGGQKRDWDSWSWSYKQFLGCPSWLRTVSALNHGATSLDLVILIGWLVGGKVGFALLSVHAIDNIFFNVWYVNYFVTLNLFYH